MTIFDRIREALKALAHRSPIVITTHKRLCAGQRNAFVLGVDWGTYAATNPEATKMTRIVA